MWWGGLKARNKEVGVRTPGRKHELHTLLGTTSVHSIPKYVPDPLIYSAADVGWQDVLMDFIHKGASKIATLELQVYSASID